MTSSNNRHQSRHLSPSPFTPTPVFSGPLQSNDAYFAALAPAFRVVLAVAILLFSRVCRAFEDSLRYNCDHNTKKFRLASLAVILFMIALPGTREDKTEFFHRMFERLYAKRVARMKELRAEYIIWRQRKCWMWGGGFMQPTLANVPDVFVSANDLRSFDALIPD